MSGVPSGALTASLGPLTGAVEGRLARLEAQGFVRRLRARDGRLFAEVPQPELDDRLGWVDLPSRMVAEAQGFEALSSTAAEAGLDRALVLGMGGSSLAPEVFSRVLGKAPGRLAVSVLDSTHPDAVRRAIAAHPPESTLYVVSSKSGSTIETMSFFHTFWALAAERLETPGSRFVAITDPGSSLDGLAGERGFRAVFHGDPEVGGRFSALSAFGLVPAALQGADVREIVGGGARRLESPATALVLGAAIGEAALAGRDKLTLVTDSALASFPLWLEQLVAESTGKNGRGVVPVAAEERRPAGQYDDDRIFVILESGVGESAVDGWAGDLAAAGHPVLRIRVETPHEIGGEMMRWELATAVCGAILDINPFDQPDVELAKRLAREAMGSDGETAPGGDRPIDAGSAELLEEALAEWLDAVGPGDYVAVQAFVDPTAENEGWVAALRRRLARGGRATTSGFGPRFLHSTGQLHKGGPAAGHFVQCLRPAERDLAVPESEYTYGQLLAAQALGDARALTSRGRRVLRLRLP